MTEYGCTNTNGPQTYLNDLCNIFFYPSIPCFVCLNFQINESIFIKNIYFVSVLFLIGNHCLQTTRKTGANEATDYPKKKVYQTPTFFAKKVGFWAIFESLLLLGGKESRSVCPWESEGSRSSVGGHSLRWTRVILPPECQGTLWTVPGKDQWHQSCRCKKDADYFAFL